MTIIDLPEPPENTIVAWWDPNDDLHAVAYRTDQHVEPGAETYRWYITDGDGHGDPLEWHELLSEMEGFRGPSVLMSRGRLEMPSTPIEPAGPRPGAPTMTIIPGYRLAQIKISSALSELERIAQAVAKERDGVARAHEEALRDVGQLRARVEELEAPIDDPVTYLLWSGRHDAWWAPDERGYVASIERAGRYNRADAVRCVVQSAQCGVREQVTSMVAAPDNWAVTP